MRRARAGGRRAAFGRALALVLTAVAAAGLLGCTEWLDADDGSDEPELRLPPGRPIVLPSAPAETGSRGPLVPATPGLRVPLAGYWTRARLDAADVLLPYTWASLLSGKDRVLLRIEAATSSTDDPGVGGGGQTLRAVIPIALPSGADASALAGLTLGPQALAAATVALRTSGSDLWLATLDRLTLEVVRGDLVMGSMEGDARRGAKGQRPRRFECGFLALRAPEPSAPMPAPALAPDGVPPPPPPPGR